MIGPTCFFCQAYAAIEDSEQRQDAKLRDTFNAYDIDRSGLRCCFILFSFRFDIGLRAVRHCPLHFQPPASPLPLRQWSARSKISFVIIFSTLVVWS